ncbi:MAG: hypothetical protein P8X96_17260 [Desulfobacteraceae bacterium]
MENKNIQLDDEAQSLFEQLGGLESWKEHGTTGGDRLAETLRAEQMRLDKVRILLIRTAFLVSRYLKDDAFAGGNADESEVFAQLSDVLVQLSDLSGHLGCAFIRFRGAPSDPELPDKYDYELVIGNTTVDSLMAPSVARRNAGQAAKLPELLLDAFSVFADYGVNNIYIEIPDNIKTQLPIIRVNLKILSGFRQSRRTGSSVLVDLDGRQITVPVINDESLFPDPNLTLLAGLNRLKVTSMEALVEKIDHWLRKKSDPKSNSNKYTAVYNAALEFPKIRAQLRKPLVEMNNVKWLISETKEENVTLEKAYVARLALEMAGATPQKVAKLIKSIYGDDYARINKTILGERLNLSSDLLWAAEKRTEKTDVRKELLGNLSQRLDQVKDHVIDAVEVSQAGDGEDAADGSGKGVHHHVYQMVNFYKGRSTTHKKMVGMVHRPIAFKSRDYKILAKDFRISHEDAVALVDKLKNCFGEGGCFQKKRFHDACGHFKQYEQKIFGFLWHHMKDAILPGDRVAFLNALQELTAQMKQPKRAFKILLEDICSDPEKVQFSDNKALMLANLIVHRPDKSLADYEITPEDIVLNQHNLDPMVVQYAAWRIDKEREQFFTKVKTIHTKMMEALCLGETSEKHIPASVLLNLERELYIFLAMVACDTGKSILRSAVNEYGDPHSEIYQQKESDQFLGGMIQNLRVSLRGLGTVGGMQDINILEGVKQHNENFQRLKNDRQFRTQARLVTEWADEAIKIIKFKS